MIQNPISERRSLVLGIVSVLFLLMAYTVLSYVQHVKNPDDKTIPTWSQMANGIKTAFEGDKRGERWIVEDTKATMLRLVLGLSASVTGAILVGILMGCFSSMDSAFSPILLFFSKIIPTAALAVFFSIVGIGLNMYVTMIAFGTMPLLAMSISKAAQEFPEELKYKTYTLGASNAEVVCNGVIPWILPKMIDLIKLMIGPALVFLIAGELVVGDVGFGYRIRILSRKLSMDVVYPYLVILSLYGFLLSYGLELLQRVLCPWYKKERK